MKENFSPKTVYEPIHINLLGELSISLESWGQKRKRVDSLRRSNRLWSMLAYLAINRNTTQSNEHLIQTFWSDAKDYETAVRALWLAASRIRKALEDLGIPNGRDVIQSTIGGYRWNPDQPVVIDSEEFERLTVLRLTEKEHRLDRTLEAISLYGGDFWCRGVGSVWETPLQVYYKSLFLTLCDEGVEALWAAERWQEAADICTKAIASEPGNEKFSVLYMQAMTNLRQPQKALDHYERIKATLKKDYQVELSSELELARSEAASQILGKSLSTTAVAESLKIDEAEGAFYCDYPTFRKVVELELRAARRSGTPFQIVLLDVDPDDSDAPLATHMKRVERALMENLRMGDPFTRLAASQFLILLPNAEPQHVQGIMTRVEVSFAKQCTHAEPKLLYHTVSLDEFLGLGG